MPTNSRIIKPINWSDIVSEAKRRRKAENLTQREHAVLANVSIPTVAAFDRGEHKLTLSKAFDILRVVGLIDEQTENGAQERFVRDARARWRSLTEGLPEDAPDKFLHGSYQIDYALEGDLKKVSLKEFEQILRRATVRYTGWPVFWVPSRAEISPKEVDGTVECWLGSSVPGTGRAFQDAAHCDFWRGSPSGRMFLLRGYQEDAQETFPPGRIFDPTLPIWRLGEALVHAARLASLLKEDESSDINVRFRAVYTGLQGRILRSWANPLFDLLVEGQAAQSDEAILETQASAMDIEGNLAQHVFPLVSSLYERFGVTGLTQKRVGAEVERLQAASARFGN